MLRYYAAEKVYCTGFVEHGGMLTMRESGESSAHAVHSEMTPLETGHLQMQEGEGRGILQAQSELPAGLGEVITTLKTLPLSSVFSLYLSASYSEHLPSQPLIFQNKIEKGKKIVEPVCLSLT